MMHVGLTLVNAMHLLCTAYLAHQTEKTFSVKEATDKMAAAARGYNFVRGGRRPGVVFYKLCFPNAKDQPGQNGLTSRKGNCWLTLCDERLDQ